MRVYGAYAVLLVARLAAADPLLSAEGGALFDSNVNNGQHREDIKSDTAAYLAASVGEALQLGTHTRLLAAAKIEAQRFAHYSELDRTAPELALTLRAKGGLGADAPWMRASIAATKLYVRDDLRSGYQYRGAVATGKRIGESWSLDAEYALERRIGGVGEEEVPGLSTRVFDQSSHSVALGANYIFGAATVLRLGYTRRSGDVTATTRPALNIYRAAGASADDPVFGEEGYAYTLYAVTQTVGATLSYELDRHSALNLAYRRQISHGVEGFNYYNNQMGLNYSYRY